MSSILIVDDDQDLKDTYVAVFQQAGFTVLSAADGVQGLALAKQHKPDIIFTGISMPELTGFELMEKLKTNRETAVIPVIIFSHLGRDEDREKAHALGAKAFVIKGITSPKEVKELVQTILGRKLFQVVIDPNKLDAEWLKQELGLSGEMILELFLGAKGLDENQFEAHFVGKGGVSKARAQKQGDASDFSKILRDMESEIDN